MIIAPAGKRPAKTLAAGCRHAPGTGSARASARKAPLVRLARIDITDREVPGDHALLVRRSISTGELAIYCCYTLTPVPLATLVAVAGRR